VQHHEGRDANYVLELSRDTVAKALNAKPSEIVFTSGGTESDVIALWGAVLPHFHNNPHVIVSSIEHPAVRNTARALARVGVQVTEIPVNSMGYVDPDAVISLVKNETRLISVMHGNNEVGTIQPIKEIALIAKERNILFHTDAVQTFGKLDIDVQELGMDFLSVSAHKIYGPKGVGALYVRNGTRFESIITGGSQESSRRAGTQNLTGITGFAKAVELAIERRNDSNFHLNKLTCFLRSKFVNFPWIQVTSPEEGIPGLLHFILREGSGEGLIIQMDLAGISVSSGSACSSGSIVPSHVLRAMGFSTSEANNGIRISFGRDNTEQDVDRIVEVLEHYIQMIGKTKLKTVEND
jgi:cysteine desulfurase